MARAFVILPLSPSDGLRGREWDVGVARIRWVAYQHSSDARIVETRGRLAVIVDDAEADLSQLVADGIAGLVELAHGRRWGSAPSGMEFVAVEAPLEWVERGVINANEYASWCRRERALALLTLSEPDIDAFYSPLNDLDSPTDTSIVFALDHLEPVLRSSAGGDEGLFAALSLHEGESVRLFVRGS